MTITHPSPEEGHDTITLSFFLITLPRSNKSQNGVTQCYNCQQFGHFWVKCIQPWHCLWCGGSHPHRECPDKEKKENSSPSCCNCILKEGDFPTQQTTEAIAMQRRRCSGVKTRRSPKMVWQESSSLQNASPRNILWNKSAYAAPEASAAPTTATSQGARDECQTPDHTAPESTWTFHRSDQSRLLSRQHVQSHCCCTADCNSPI